MTSPWTNETVAKISELWKVHSAEQISHILWRDDRILVSRNAVVGKINRLGLTISDKSRVHPLTRHNGHERPKAAPPVAKGTVGSKAYAVIHGIKKQQARAIAPIEDPVQAEPTPIEIIAGRVSLLSAASDQCRWPAADDGGASMVCGTRVHSSGPWCAHHARRAYEPARRGR
jgi:GcrA cell cycle regulator